MLRFDERFAAQTPQAFIDDVLLRGLGARYVLVGDDFRFGARRAGDYAMLDAAGDAAGFDVARMQSYEVHGQRVSSSAVREALAGGDMARAAAPARPALQHQRPCAAWRQARPRARFSHLEPALRPPAAGGDGHLRASRVHGLAADALPAWPAWACGRRSKTAAACCSKPIAWTGPPRWAAKVATAA